MNNKHSSLKCSFAFLDTNGDLVTQYFFIFLGIFNISMFKGLKLNLNNNDIKKLNSIKKYFRWKLCNFKRINIIYI